MNLNCLNESRVARAPLRGKGRFTPGRRPPGAPAGCGGAERRERQERNSGARRFQPGTPRQPGAQPRAGGAAESQERGRAIAAPRAPRSTNRLRRRRPPTPRALPAAALLPSTRSPSRRLSTVAPKPRAHTSPVTSRRCRSARRPEVRRAPPHSVCAQQAPGGGGGCEGVGPELRGGCARTFRGPP